MALRALSLCAGIGGLDLGVSLAVPSRTVCFVEREAFAAAILVARMADGSLAPAPVWNDLRNFGARAWRGGVDLVCAGYPCQPFSVAGKRRGVEDERHLWPHVARILEESGAPLLFCENVPGHLRLGFEVVLQDLAALGFDAEWGLFRASDVGAPHKRERLFFLAYRQGFDRGLLVQPGRSREACTEPNGRGEGLAHTAHDGHEQSGRARAGRNGSAHDGLDVGDAGGCRCGGRAQAPLGGSLGRTALERAGCELGDADGSRLEGRCVCGCQRADERFAWPTNDEMERERGCPRNPNSSANSVDLQGLRAAERMAGPQRNADHATTESGRSGSETCGWKSSHTTEGSASAVERRNQSFSASTTSTGAGASIETSLETSRPGSEARGSQPDTECSATTATQQSRTGQSARTLLREVWPPGPADSDGWREWLERGGPLPAVRRGADGAASRLDRLRALGNGVVPSVAARAFRTLSERVLA